MINPKPRNLRNFLAPEKFRRSMINWNANFVGAEKFRRFRGFGTILITRVLTKSDRLTESDGFVERRLLPNDLGGSIMIHFISTTATETTCPRCHARLLTAFDEGLRVTVDAEPLAKPADEIAALLAGKWTYTLTRNRHLVHRTPERIAAGTLAGSIHAAHKCKTPTQLTIDMIGQKK